MKNPQSSGPQASSGATARHKDDEDALSDNSEDGDTEHTGNENEKLRKDIRRERQHTQSVPASKWTRTRLSRFYANEGQSQQISLSLSLSKDSSSAQATANTRVSRASGSVKSISSQRPNLSDKEPLKRESPKATRRETSLFLTVKSEGPPRLLKRASRTRLFPQTRKSSCPNRNK